MKPELKPFHMNCLIDSVRAMLLRRGLSQHEAVRHLVQPLNFGFEVELSTRDWWLGGHSGVYFQKPVFRHGLSATWVDSQDGIEAELAARQSPDHPFLFQVEWSKVSYSPHHGFNMGDIHVATVYEQSSSGQRLLVRDRMSADPSLFDADFLGWQDVETYVPAADRRLRILDWHLAPPASSFDDELDVVLAESRDLMTLERDSYAPGPHQHIVTGLAGLQEFAEILDIYKPEFCTDAQTRMLLGIRLVDTARTVAGDRILLMHALEVSRRDWSHLEACFAEGVASWHKLTKVMRTESKAPVPSLPRVADAIRTVAKVEARAVDALGATG